MAQAQCKGLSLGQEPGKASKAESEDDTCLLSDQEVIDVEKTESMDTTEHDPETMPSAEILGAAVVDLTPASETREDRSGNVSSDTDRFPKPFSQGMKKKKKKKRRKARRLNLSDSDSVDGESSTTPVEKEETQAEVPTPSGVVRNLELEASAEVQHPSGDVTMHEASPPPKELQPTAVVTEVKEVKAATPPEKAPTPPRSATPPTPKQVEVAQAEVPKGSPPVKPLVPKADPKVDPKESPKGQSKVPKVVTVNAPKPAKGKGELKSVDTKVKETEAEGEHSEAGSSTEAAWHPAESKKNRRKRAKRAHKAELAAADTRVNVRLSELIDHNGTTRLPPRQNPNGESDDEDWLEDDSHPIDWYVREIERVLESQGIINNTEVKAKLEYAWSYYVPGDPCPFSRCQGRTGGRGWVRCSSRARFARHLLDWYAIGVLRVLRSRQVRTLSQLFPKLAGKITKRQQARTKMETMAAFHNSML